MSAAKKQKLSAVAATSVIDDWRSDTVTRPTDEMRAAMAAAVVGDDVYGDDPTVNALEQEAIALCGVEAAVFVCSGTQANVLALLSHCDRGDEYIVGRGQHNFLYEGGGAAVIGSVMPCPLTQQADGTLKLSDILAAVKPNDYHYPRTKLLSLENTYCGMALSMSYMTSATALARDIGLSTHLDGARVFNAVTALGVHIREVAALFDTMSICLSKGLGAPVGSLLVGKRDVISRARRWRKVLGGGMRQCGILAAAGRIALSSSSIARLQDDHDVAVYMGAALQRSGLFRVDFNKLQTNCVYAYWLCPPCTSVKGDGHDDDGHAICDTIRVLPFVGDVDIAERNGTGPDPPRMAALIDYAHHAASGGDKSVAVPSKDELEKVSQRLFALQQRQYANIAHMINDVCGVYNILVSGPTPPPITYDDVLAEHAAAPTRKTNFTNAIRFVTHIDVTRKSVDRLVELLKMHYTASPEAAAAAAAWSPPK